MKTKLFALPLLLLILAAPSFSNDRAVENIGIAGDRIVDNAGLLSDTERRALAALLDSVSLAHNFDIVIVSEKSIGQKTPEAFADDFFDNNGYGLGSGQDGTLFLQVTGSRDIHVSTAGRGIKTLRPAAREKLLSDAAKHLKKGETYAAYRAVVADWDKYLKLEAKGKSYNALDQSHITLTAIAWLIAFGIGMIVVASWKSGMNTAKQQTQAASYVVAGSLDFAVKKDTFLYSTVTKVKRQTTPNAATTGGTLATLGKLGGHIASSGRTHGGGGRKY